VATLDEAIRGSAIRRAGAPALADAPNRRSFFSGEPLRLTWSGLDRAVDSLAADLRRIGAGPEAPVAVQLPNVVELVLTILACGRIGAVCVPFPIQHRRHELRQGLTATSAAVMVTGNRPDRPDQLDIVAALAGDLDQPLQIAAFGEAAVDNAARLEVDAEAARIEADPTAPADADNADTAPPAAHGPDTGNETTLAAEPTPASGADPSAATERPAAAAPVGPHDVLTVCWTSGTTGTPKGVPRTSAMWLAAGRVQIDELELGADDRILCPFPLVNMAGIGGMLLPWAITGSALLLHQPLDLPVFLGQLSSEGITYTVAPPALLNMLLLDDSILAGVDLQHLRKITSGAAPLDPWMVAGWAERGVEIVNVFGSNEGAALISTAATVPDPELRARCFPRPTAPGIEVRMVDLDSGDEIVTPGRPGELRFAGPTVFDGYLDSDGDEFDDEGFYRTGDIFEWEDTTAEPWLLRFVDRAKDIVIRGGMNVSAAELEGLIAGHGAVAECAVVGYPDEVLGERVGVFVVGAGDTEPTLEAIIGHLKDVGIASYKLPERIEVTDALPRNPLGKVVKDELRRRWAAEAAAPAQGSQASAQSGA